jgi:predicted phage gp36 major capsid-like protein
MKIIIQVLNDDDSPIYKSESLSFESAEQELGKFERMIEEVKQDDMRAEAEEVMKDDEEDEEDEGDFDISPDGDLNRA